MSCVEVIGRAVLEALKARGKHWITTGELADMLGIPGTLAGRILSSMEKKGYLRRYSRKTFKVMVK